jgi:squalene-hopene/tetraprenyl-beta-curcumene cyclase
MTRDEVEGWYHYYCQRLLSVRDEYGVWRGHLSSSALATAVAAFALRRFGGPARVRAALDGEAWLVRTILHDGSWGDTPESPGNLSTTLLGLAALRHSPRVGAKATVHRAEAWVHRQAGNLGPEALTTAVLEHYGADRTFAVPILSQCALAGILGDAPACWERVPQLPFALAVLPRATFRLIGLPVVSYALPALIALGVLRQRCGPRQGRGWRRLFEGAALRRLARLQPGNGGFLEAVPLTGFVALSLHAVGRVDDPVARQCVEFLLAAQREGGSWPIDSNLATWVTTLSTVALHDDLPAGERAAVATWLLGQQFREVHPYTGAAPGGWGWTDLPGRVPDADDSAGALLALQRLGVRDAATHRAVEAGVTWLLDLANRDGGIPTFCRGWGRLPFDRSCPDITAHVVRAVTAWRTELSPPLQARVNRAVPTALRYLENSQLADGSWLPLWFGNDAAPKHVNPVYGTARVLRALADLPELHATPPACVQRGLAALLRRQAQDGGWGGAKGVAPSIEETALAVTALARWPGNQAATARGIEWLLCHPEQMEQPRPIGLYFASLWYHEALYPLIFTIEALREWLASSAG